jgi:hypothetical protein
MMPVLFVGFFMVALLMGEIVYELISGKLLARGWKVYARHQDNPMLFWSSLALQMLVALFVLCMVILVAAGSKG